MRDCETPPAAPKAAEPCASAMPIAADPAAAPPAPPAPLPPSAPDGGAVAPPVEAPDERAPCEGRGQEPSPAPGPSLEGTGDALAGEAPTQPADVAQPPPESGADAPTDAAGSEDAAPQAVGAPPATGPEADPSDLLKAFVEAVLFASDRPISSRKIAEVLQQVGDEAPQRSEVDGHLVRRLIERLRAEYDRQGRAFQIEEIAGGYQMLTRPEYHQCVRALSVQRQQAKLTPAAIETLAIIAYKQPVSRAAIEDIRGVQSGPMIRTLMEKRLVRVVGREEVPGRPLLYGTTREFLEHFGLKSLKDLPTIKELPKPA